MKRYKIKEFGLAFSLGIRYNDNCFRDVAQVVERYFREVEVASSSLVIPIIENLESIVLSRFFMV